MLLHRCTVCDEYITTPYWVDERHRAYCTKHATEERQYMEVILDLEYNEAVKKAKEREEKSAA
jgi:hypothetical protein